MLRRLFLAVLVLALFFISAVVVLAARAPRTWATHWTNPISVSPSGGEYDYGAVRTRSGRWDLLWVDAASQKLVYTVAQPDGRVHSVIVDSGDVAQPDLALVSGREIGTWVHNHNGRSVLMGARLGPGPTARSFSVVSSAAPLEHPTIVRGPQSSPSIIFSWQRDGNFELFLSRLGPGHAHSAPHRLQVASAYSFYPRATRDLRGVMHVLHLESCCSQKTWLVEYDRYDANGKHLGRTQTLLELQSLPNGAPAQWPEDLTIDRAGHVWGAYAGDAGFFVFEAASNGHLLRGPTPVDSDAGRPNSLSLSVGTHVGYVTWEQAYDLGTYIDTLRFGVKEGASSQSERTSYGSGSQLEPHAFTVKDRGIVLWELTGHGSRSVFQSANYRSSGNPTLAQRLGLGLGNPWGEVALLVLGSLGFATLTTTVNILWIFLFTLIGILLLRFLHWLPSKWLVYACVLTCLLFIVFVSPGAPILFLDTMPASGLPVVPFGLMATGATLGFVTLLGTALWRHVDAAYRAGLMAFIGVYFFAFLEAVVFIQQRLGYI